MALIELLSELRVSPDKAYDEGERIDVSDEQAEHLISIGAAKEVKSGFAPTASQITGDPNEGNGQPDDSPGGDTGGQPGTTTAEQIQNDPQLQ